MTKQLSIFMLAFLALLQTASANDSGWKYSGSLFILTTPEGANLPSTAREANFPLLVRLNKEWFDFSQAKAKGEDIRFTDATGAPLAYQIDTWGAAAGSAAIWVRIPEIKGNARQEVKMHWGKADAASESNGKAVFNEGNGYLSVFHLDDSAQDATGLLEGKDQGTTQAAGVIGQSRHFAPGKGINCGENITAFPTGSSPHSSEAWFRIEQSNTPIMAWGNDAPQGKVITRFASPPHVLVETWFSGADVHGRSKVPLSQWTHVAHTYKNGESCIYVNGVLDGSAMSAGAPLAIKSPARLYIGGWCNNYTCLGEIDEVRISKVTRSADWVKLQYENQKDMQTAVGPLVQPGNDFSVSTIKIALTEAKSITVTAQAGGAQKIVWLIKRGAQETVAATDQFSFTLEAGRVTGDEAFTLQFKAVFAQEVKTVDIPVTVKEDIPDPVYTLQAPTRWDGRTPIEVVPQITNLQALKTKGVDNLKTKWNVSGIATSKDIDAGKLRLLRANNSGVMTVTATVSNGGKPVTQAHRIMVKEPAKDLWVQRTPGRDEKPVNNQFYARDDKNEGTLHFNGTFSNATDSVFVKLYADDKLIRTESQTPARSGAGVTAPSSVGGATGKALSSVIGGQGYTPAVWSYAFSLKLKAGLIKYKVEFGTKSGSAETVLNTVTNLVCGDAYIVNGQSNAVAYNYANEKDRPELTGYSSTWIRSFGGNGEAGELVGGWGNAVIQRLTPESPDRVCFIGVWCMALAKKVMEDERMPICILNGAVGGTRIDEHMPDPTNHLNPTKRSIYRNLLLRVVAANLTHGIRGVLWHQGESDQGADGPDGGFGCDTYQQYFMDLTAAWKLDFPNIQHYYVYQIWPNSCSMGGNGASDKLRDIERTFTRLYSNLGVMSTLDLLSGACHFNLTDYEKMGVSMARLVERDNYGRIFDKPITPPDLLKACYTSDKKDEIALEFDQPMVWSDALTSQFYLDRKAGVVVAGSVSGKVITLKLAKPSTAITITYLVDKHWDIKNILYGHNNIAALTFCEVAIENK